MMLKLNKRGSVVKKNLKRKRIRLLRRLLNKNALKEKKPPKIKLTMSKRKKRKKSTRKLLSRHSLHRKLQLKEAWKTSMVTVKEVKMAVLLVETKTEVVLEPTMELTTKTAVVLIMVLTPKMETVQLTVEIPSLTRMAFLMINLSSHTSPRSTSKKAP